MNINLMPFGASWVVLAVAILILAIYRHRLSSQEDDTLHVSDPQAAQITKQALEAHRIEVIDRWGKLLTVIGVVYGLLLGAAYFYQYWTQTSNQMFK
jgi:hypothetical protein